MAGNISEVWDSGLSANNTTSTGGNTLLSAPEFAVFYLLILLILFVALFLTFFSVVGLCGGVGIPRVLAIFLVHQLLSCVIVAVIMISFVFSVLWLTLSKSITQPPLEYCQFLIWGYAFGAVGRLWSLAIFSIIVYLTVRYGQNILRHTRVFAASITFVWVVTFLLNIHVMLPYPVYAVQFVDNVACYPHNAIVPKKIRYSTLSIWIVFGGIVPLAISIIIPIFTLCYIKRNTVTEQEDDNKRIAKFALFLVSSNVVNLLGQAVPGLVALYAEAPGVVLAYVFVSLSLLPTPTIIIMFIKPVRRKMKKILCCCVLFNKHHRRSPSPVLQDHPTCKTNSNGCSTFKESQP